MGYSVKGKQGFQTTHGLRNHPLYGIWTHMKSRCYNPKTPDYRNYGARGITVCDEWKNDFVEFLYWALKHGWQMGLTIERVDYDRGYAPDNCTWIPMGEQSKNRRTVRRITHNGETHTISEWAKIVGINRRTLERRLSSSTYSVERALTEPTNKALARR